MPRFDWNSIKIAPSDFESDKYTNSESNLHPNLANYIKLRASTSLSRDVVGNENVIVVSETTFTQTYLESSCETLSEMLTVQS